MTRYLTRGLQVALDLLVLSAAYWLAFLFRFEFRIPATWMTVALATWPYVVGLEYAVLSIFGVPRFSWRYIGMRETARMAQAMATAALVLGVLRLSLEDVGGLLGFVVVPLGVIGSNFALAFLALVALRALRRLYGERKERLLRDEQGDRDRVLLIGAGQAGVLVARELAARPDLGLEAVAFIDDDRNKVGMRISGLPVLGTTAKLVEIARAKRVRRALITIANASGADIRRIAMLCKGAGIDTKIIPGIYEIVGDSVNLSRIREVAIEDLLGREPVQLDAEAISAGLRDRVVMVTGAGGSIGSELCRQVCRFGPKRLILVERFENALFEIHRELVGLHPSAAIDPRIADVCDARRVQQLFSELRPEVVFHAAAHKHVPMMEHNPGEAIKNNVNGTIVVAETADRFGASAFVMISTDKAVNPTSVMGASKRVAEIFTQSLAQRSKTKFITVRFGNVLGSNGSVIPIFKEQIARGGPVTVTHPEMRRYFMTIPEASQLVLQAGTMGQGGEIFILDMGEPVKIVDLARDLIRLSGMVPDEDIEIVFSGVRPGEKLFEELSTSSERADKTKHPKIFIGRTPPSAGEDTARLIRDLLELAEGGAGGAGAAGGAAGAGGAGGVCGTNCRSVIS
ncbi:MAG TPA: nucleoside-diphosphate sugar epimerase/dehydratase, partial [Kofleriaceae bacterium]|nr:nucleoside-diphosphate sugar epimerase/dehydratase [Kofleriaceae bacterium]